MAERLGRDYERARERHASADAPATRSIYAAAWKKFASYCRERAVPSLPAHPEVVCAYVNWLAESAPNKTRGRPGFKPATIELARAAISSEHQRAGHESPTKDDRVRRVLRSVRRELTTRQRRAKPLMPEHLAAILRWLDKRWSHPARVARDKAILVAGWAGALRRGELVALRRSDVKIRESGVLFFVRRSKTDQEGKGAHVDFDRIAALEEAGACPVKVLREWDAFLVDDEGDRPFLRQVREGDVLEEPVSAKKVERLVRDGVEAIGLKRADYSAHSLRAGLATYYIYVVKKNPWDVKKHLRHKTVAMLDVYVRDWDAVPSQAPPENEHPGKKDPG